ncbi:AAA family ATPase [Brucepastera parasyntrophica]|uniref:AAA family ATPase n=1 Tax=Brucepastera parasyntrophica TaxID=2880008 RepID=UPI003F6F4ABA
MRPRNLDEYIGQEHIVGQGRLLRRAIQADRLSSLIFYGPPGTGKTTLAQVIANHTESNFVTLNAVLAGVQQIRDAIAEADKQRHLYNRKTILFVDEVHRWNRAQQDALLPWVENGTIILVGATTENPFFEVNKALVSRSRIFQLKQLTQEDLLNVARSAVQDPERGYGKWKIEFEENALDHLVETAGGDARSVLNALELAIETSVPRWPPPENSRIYISTQTAEESIQQKVVLYDRDGDYHYDVISAFIKSLRGRDPDAALYWLARMVAAGESPTFIFRRMLISACEDTGLADPHAITVIESCANAFDRVGLPEGRFFLTHAALYLATAPKSNSAMAFFDALASVEKEDTEVPNHLRDSHRDAEGFGHGQGYMYPHAYRDHWTAQQYLPDPLVGKVFYTPSSQGYEGKIREEVLTHRELQIAAILEEYEFSGQDESLSGKRKTPGPKGEILTFSPGAAQRDRWVKRLDSGKSDTLLAVRNEITSLAEISRHDRVLIYGADDGLLIWEAGRLAPEGLTAGICHTARSKQILEQYAATLEELDRPLLLTLPEMKNQYFVFDKILAREPAADEKNILEFIDTVKPLCALQGRIVFSARIPVRGMRISRLLDEKNALFGEIASAEEKVYTDTSNPLFAWDENTLAGTLRNKGYFPSINLSHISESRRILPDDIERWFSPESPYGNTLHSELGEKKAGIIKEALKQTVSSAPVSWEYDILYAILSL